jgi:hypothetical protein
MAASYVELAKYYANRQSKGKVNQSPRWYQGERFPSLIGHSMTA